MPKREAAGDDNDAPKSNKRTGGAGPRSQEEELAVFRAIHELALRNLPAITNAPGLEKRDAAKVNNKARALMKKAEQALGGDGKWIDAFKIGNVKKE